MEFQDVVRKRKMVRSFEDRPIPREIVDRLLANALRGPSAGFSQGWGFLVLEGGDETARYWDALWPVARRADWGWPDLFNAPLLITCCSEKEVYKARYAEPDKGWTDKDERHWPVAFWDIDTAMAAMLILLTTVDSGLGAVFFGISNRQLFKKTFGVPDDTNPIGTIAVGYPKATDRPSPSLKRGHRPFSATIHRGHW